MTLFNLPTTGPGVLLVHAGDDPGIIVNRDLVNTVILTNAPSAYNISGSVLDPLTFVQFSGEVDVYGIATGSVVVVDVMPQIENWSPSPAQSAASIAALGLATLAQQVTQQTAIPGNIATTGVPGLVMSTMLLNQASTNIAAGGTFTSSVLTFNQLGYNILLSLIDNAAGTASAVCSVTVTWIDSTTGLVLYTDLWHICPGASGSTAHLVGGVGPTKGNQVQISIKNNDSVQVAFTLKFLVNSRTYGKDDWRSQNPFPGFQGQTNPNSDVNAQTLFDVSPSINNATTITRICPLYAGAVTMQFHSTPIARYQVNTLDPNVLAYGVCASCDTAAGVNTVVQATLPQAQCVVSIQNLGATGTCQMEITTVDII
jgi:hypothetical protein